MMMRQEFILCKDGELFDERLNTALHNGATVVPWTIAIQETDSGRQWFSCVVKYEVEPGNPVLPVMSDEERQINHTFLALPSSDNDIDKLMMGLAAASSSSFVSLLYNNLTGNWMVLNGNDNIADLNLWPDTLTDSPYRSLAAAILEVQSNGS